MTTDAAGHPVARRVRDELGRLGERWRTLPLAQALPYAGRVHALAQRLADRVAESEGRARIAVPDLGAGVVVDQLRVLAYDAAAAGLVDGLADELATLRRQLA